MIKERAREASTSGATALKERQAERRWAAATALLGLVVVALVTWHWVPLHALPGASLPQVAAGDVFTEEQLRRAESYSSVARLLGWGSLALGLAVSVALGFGPWGARLVGRLRGPWWLRQLLVCGLVLALVRITTLPVSLVAWRWRVRYGLATQSLPGWLRDVGVSWLISTLLMAGIVLVVGLMVRWMPRRWPAALGALLVGLTCIVSFGYPVVVEPLFNRFTPLPESPLRTEILRLARQEGVPVTEVLVADASRRTTTLNAYVSGFGASRRVVLYDTLVEQLPEDQVLAVSAHELAHARHRDVWWGTALGAGGILLAVGVGGVLAAGRRWGDPTGVPRLLAVIAVGSLLVTPLQSAVSRQIEWRADVAALSSGASPAAVIELQRELALRSLADPTPPKLAYAIFGTHPLALQRIALAQSVLSED